ncbi:sulfurtransferase [Tepidiforma flava]|uniref:thiosulfate sulfurtransferase n=1 Tax=Tepidiforma flava TaxID=3004094 RepID=A0ABY7M4W4_9CHLR|nr:sulfurtransferase [Tepidiforma flava]WBL35566.1 sulfurtransferase [Tepidiforma flava]
MGYARPELLAEPDWLQQHLDDPGVRIIDCAVLEAYRRAHIPGAVHLPVHYYIKEAGPPGADHGTFVMPPAEFEALMGRLGVSNDTLVVTYDDNNALVAARLWWVLNYYGHTNVKVLNGGWHRWLTEGRPITFHATRPKSASFTARPNPDLIADAEYLKARIGDPGCQILDARTDAEWDGTNDRGNRRVGRVPGAKHLEWVRFVETADTRRFLPAEAIERLLAEAGFARGRATITYCQGGIRAAHAAFAMTLVGYDDIRVYDGSMRDWANRDDTPLTLE